MESSPRGRRKSVAAAEAKEVLVQTVLGLVQTVPLPELTARRIAREAGMDAKTIFRCFTNLDDLFVTALRALEQRILEELDKGAGEALTPLLLSQSYARFASWLYMTGVDPASLAISAEFSEMLRATTLGRNGVPPETDERVKAALFVLWMSFLQSQVNVAPYQPEIFDPQAVADARHLMQALVERLPELSDDLTARPPTVD